MSIEDIENSKKLKKQGARLGRDGLSQRVHNLVKDYIDENPDGHYKDAIILAGKIHAIFLATNGYWREKAMEGFISELYNLGKFNKCQE